LFIKKILPHLDFLDLSDNYIEQISLNFINSAKNLKKLYFSRNKLQEIPVEIEILQSLTHLHINGNCFTSIPLSMAKLRLEELNLDWFEYLDPPLAQPLQGHQNFDTFCEKLSHFGMEHISIEVFPKVISGKFKFKILTGEDSSLCRAVYKGHLGMIEYIGNEFPALLNTENAKGFDPYNLALKLKRVNAFTSLVQIKEDFNYCKDRIN
jgi:hypothetical protein